LADPARVIYRFGRSYTEFDPDGASGGPSTWILSSSGDGPENPGDGSNNNNSGSGIFRPLPGTDDRLIYAGMALYLVGDAYVSLAVAKESLADGLLPYTPCGLALSDAIAEEAVTYISDGLITLWDWSNVADGTPEAGGELLLVPGRRYYLSDTTPGRMTLNCPSTPGSFAVSLGTALTPNVLEVEINLIARI
jgi:hypothetical protein